MAEPSFYCPVCGEPITHDELMRGEGSCEPCCERLSEELMLHNFQQDRWNRMSDSQRAAEIRQSMRIA